MFKTPWNDNRAEMITHQRDRLFRIALAWCGDYMLADDLAQDAVSKGIANKSQLQDPDKLPAWIFRILHNCWMEYLRRYRPMLDIDTDEFISNEEPESDFNEMQIIRSVRQAVAKLPIGQRQVISLVDLEERSYAEVAEILGIPIGTVMSRLNRARTLLKIHLKNIDEPSTMDRPQLRSVK